MDNSDHHTKEKPQRIPIKVERARASRNADIMNGIASALLKKQLQNKKKKEKKLRKHIQNIGSDSEPDLGLDSDHDLEKSINSVNINENSNDENSDSENSDRDENDIHIYREIHKINLILESDKNILQDTAYYPILNFEEVFEYLKNDADKKNTLREIFYTKFTKPTPIQAQAWPIILNNIQIEPTHNILGIAQTGTGKTLAYLIPIIINILNMDKNKTKSNNDQDKTISKPIALILAPTRELTIQVAQITEDWCSLLDICTCSLNGGSDINLQSKTLLENNVQICIATPGRLIKHINANTISLSNISTFVIDEADKMLDLTFTSDLKTIFELLPFNRQNLLFSATWPEHMSNLINSLSLKEHLIQINIGSEKTKPANTITQITEVIDRRNGGRERRLLELINNYYNVDNNNRILIFVLYKSEVKTLKAYLKSKFKLAEIGSINGDFSQTQRTRAIDRFRSGDTPVLIATDVAARGLDIDEITHVINFSAGLSIEHYVHRIGRCGRAGNIGTSHTFIVDYDNHLIPELVKLLNDSLQFIPPELKEIAEREEKKQSKTQLKRPKGDLMFIANSELELEKEKDDEIDKLIFGTDESNIKYFIQQGKKTHPSQIKNSKLKPKSHHKQK